MTYFPHKSPHTTEPMLTGQTYQALLWIHTEPRSAADLARLQHITPESARRRIGHLKRLGLIEKVTPDPYLDNKYTTTPTATNRIP